jgi:hypothetical protein
VNEVLKDPKQAQAFRFARCAYVDGVAELVYAFDNGPELIERIHFPSAPMLVPQHAAALDAALNLLHLIAGVSYFKAGVPAEIHVETVPPDTSTAELLNAVYLHGLGEFAYQNKLDLRGKIRFPANSGIGENPRLATTLGLPQRTLVPIGGGKDSLVSVESLKAIGAEATAVWIGNSPLIAACAARTGLPTLNIRRDLSPLLFDYNRQGAYNGHIPVTAINSVILLVAAVLYGYDSIAFSNERSASSATLEYAGQAVNHQWSKSSEFERALHAWVHGHVAGDLNYFSLLRPYSELAVTQRFARLAAYFDTFSSCNRNFKLLGPKPADRWCCQCPKCHFVFLALAPFLPKVTLVRIFGRNLLDDETQVDGFDALLEYHQHKPFECVGEGAESRAALYALSQRPEWREDAIVARFEREILPQLQVADLALDQWLAPSGEHLVPARLVGALSALR